jgi:hypothetical protein
MDMLSQSVIQRKSTTAQQQLQLQQQHDHQSGGEVAQLQRLWWRHAPPGIDPLNCATQCDASFYARCFKSNITSKETPFYGGKKTVGLFICF